MAAAAPRERVRRERCRRGRYQNSECSSPHARPPSRREIQPRTFHIRLEVNYSISNHSAKEGRYRERPDTCLCNSSAASPMVSAVVSMTASPRSDAHWRRCFAQFAILLLAAVITADANELVAENPRPDAGDPRADDYARWLSDAPDPRDLMPPFPAEPMRMWLISRRVKKPENDRDRRADRIGRRGRLKGEIEI